MPSEDPIGVSIQRGGAQIEQSANRWQNVIARENAQQQASQEAVDERLRRAQQSVEASIHENYLREWSAKKAEGLQGRTDYQNFDTAAEQDSKEIQDYIGNIQDPELKMAVTKGAQLIIRNNNSLYRAKKWQVMGDVGKAELDKNLGYDLQEWVAASSEVPPKEGTQEVPPISDRDKIKAKMTAKIMSSSVLKETEKVNMIQGLDAKTEEAYAKQLINTDPGRALQEIPNLKNLDPIKQQTMLSTATIKIEQRDRQSEKQFKSAQEEAEQQVMDRIMAGDQIGATELLATYGKNRLLSPEKRRVLKTAIETETKAEVKSDLTTFYGLEQKVLLGKATIRDVLNTEDVSVADKNKLIKLYKDEKDPRKSYEYTEAMKSAHNEIITTGPLAALDPDQQSRFTAYKRAAEKNIQAGGDPWAFYDRNAWKYMGAVPKTSYGVMKSIEDVNAAKARLRADVESGKIKTGPAGLEAEKLEKTMEFFQKQKKATTNAGNK